MANQQQKLKMKIIGNADISKEEMGRIWNSFWKIIDEKILDNKITDSEKEKSSKKRSV